ncbi:hypothetical protein, partial [Streptomyces sp. SID3343]|uniref:hypothetical protein n=1 Tax=Streptomyces sp. SID3343 TaxID=2690260 RepID=UPI001F1664E6
GAVPRLGTTDTAEGRLTHALPPFAVEGLPASRSHAPTPPGSDEPAWRSTRTEPVGLGGSRRTSPAITGVRRERAGRDVSAG